MTGSLQTKNDKFYIVINLRDANAKLISVFSKLSYLGSDVAINNVSYAYGSNASVVTSSNATNNFRYDVDYQYSLDDDGAEFLLNTGLYVRYKYTVGDSSEIQVIEVQNNLDAAYYIVNGKFVEELDLVAILQDLLARGDGGR